MPTKTQTLTFVYDTYIRTTPQKLWQALTDGDFSEKYWMGYRIAIDLRAGGTIRLQAPAGQDGKFGEGKVLACEPGRKLVYEFALKDASEIAAKRDGFSRVTYELTPAGETVRLRLTHENLLPEDTEKDPNTLKGVNNGWPAVLSSLKSLLETGQAMELRSGCSTPKE